MAKLKRYLWRIKHGKFETLRYTSGATHERWGWGTDPHRIKGWIWVDAAKQTVKYLMAATSGGTMPVIAIKPKLERLYPGYTVIPVAGDNRINLNDYYGTREGD